MNQDELAKQHPEYRMFANSLVAILKHRRQDAVDILQEEIRRAVESTEGFEPACLAAGTCHLMIGLVMQLQEEYKEKREVFRDVDIDVDIVDADIVDVSKETQAKGEGSVQEILKCSFCGKSQREVLKLIACPSAYICNECIEICNEIIEDERKLKG